MKKIKVVLRIITVCLFLILVGLVTYFSLINADEIVLFNENLKVDKEYQWVLTDMKDEVKEDKSEYLKHDSEIKDADKKELSKEETLSYKDSTVLIYPFYTQDGYLYITLSLANTHDIDVVLISSNSKAYKYHVRSAGEDSEMRIKYKDLDKGKYHIYINDNGEKYDTTKYININ